MSRRASCGRKMPASVKSRDAWAKEYRHHLESQGLTSAETSARCWRWRHPGVELSGNPAVPGLSGITWQEIDRRAKTDAHSCLLVHTALKIKSPNGKSYSERLDSVRTEKAIERDF
ncbi:DUF1615 family protein [Shigella flexneri]